MKLKAAPIPVSASPLLTPAGGGGCRGVFSRRVPKKEPDFEAQYFKSNETKEDYCRLHQLLSREAALYWLFAGDSITHGCCHTSYRRNFSQYFEQYVKTALERSGDFMVNTGNSGATTADMRAYFEPWVTAPQADVAFLCFGMNDCTAKGMTPALYKGNLEYAVTALRANGTLPILQTPNTSTRQKPIRPYVEAVRALARERNVLLVDHNGYWSNAGRRMKPMMSDALHPNAAGHLTWVRFLLSSLGMQREDSALFQLSLQNLNAPIPKNAADAERLSREYAPLRMQFSSYTSNKEPTVWVFAGGTGTAGNLARLAQRNYVQHFEEAARWETADKVQMLRCKTLINCGRPGYGVTELLTHYEEVIGRFQPQVVCLMPEPGAADTDFEGRLITLIRKIKQDGAALLLQTPAAETDAESVKRAGDLTNTPVLSHAVTLKNTPDALDENGRLTPAGQLAVARDLSFALLDVPKSSRMRTAK